jgi:phosphoesterase RecJ-like protein
MVVAPQFKTAYISLSLADQKKYNYQIGDSEGIVNYALSIEGIRLAAFFTEKKDKVRISFRSKGDFSVNELARTYFDGGGHKNAAGGNSYTTLIKTKRYFESLLPTLAL